jgi:serine/threonine protein kinase
MYYGAQNDVWSLGIFLAKILDIPHPYIDFHIDTESTAKRKIVDGVPDFHFQSHHMGPGRAASLIIQMLEPDADERITVSHVYRKPADCDRYLRFSNIPSLDPNDLIPFRCTSHQWKCHRNYTTNCHHQSFKTYASWHISITSLHCVRPRRTWWIDCMDRSHAGTRGGPRC